MTILSSANNGHAIIKQAVLIISAVASAADRRDSEDGSKGRIRTADPILMSDVL